MSDVTARFHGLPARSPADDLRLEPGTMFDYAGLASHHYRAARPATATRVLTLRHAAPTVVGRWIGRRGEKQTVAVLVESLPALSCRLRDVALGDRYRDLSARERARLVNREIRCISRVVVDPRWRGLGLAVRLVRAALAEPATPITEALAAMGSIHPFFERAGMVRYDRSTHPRDARLLDALTHAGIPTRDLVSAPRVLAHVATLDTGRQAWLRHELHGWYERTTRTRALHLTDTAALALARQRLLCQPTYFVRVNP